MTKMATREACEKALVELVKEDKKILVLDADLSGSAETGEMKKVAPEQHSNLGITEGDMMAAAADMAASGNIVFANTFTMFAAGRTSEQMRNSICYPHLNAKVCVTHVRLIVGEDGASHQSIEDVALMRSIPGVVAVSPADGVGTKATIRAVVEYDSPCYVRLGGMTVENVYTEDMLNFQIGKENVVRKGNSVALIATGIMVGAAMETMDIPEKNGMDVTVVDIYTIRPIDEEPIVELTEDYDLFITCEEHSVIGSLDSTVAGVLSRKAPKKLAMVGIKDTFEESGTPAAPFERYGLTANNIVKAMGDSG